MYVAADFGLILIIGIASWYGVDGTDLAAFAVTILWIYILVHLPVKFYYSSWDLRQSSQEVSPPVKRSPVASLDERTHANIDIDISKFDTKLSRQRIIAGCLMASIPVVGYYSLTLLCDYFRGPCMQTVHPSLFAAVASMRLFYLWITDAERKCNEMRQYLFYPRRTLEHISDNQAFLTRTIEIAEQRVKNLEEDMTAYKSHLQNSICYVSQLRTSGATEHILLEDHERRLAVLEANVRQCIVFPRFSGNISWSALFTLESPRIKLQRIAAFFLHALHHEDDRPRVVS